MNKIKTAVFAALTGLVVLTSFGCTQVQHEYDCLSLCSDVKTCTGGDESKCRDYCAKEASAEEAKTCNDCLSTNKDGCDQKQLKCLTECAKFKINS